MTSCDNCKSENSHYYFECECGKTICWSCADVTSHDCLRIKRHEEYD